MKKKIFAAVLCIGALLITGCSQQEAAPDTGFIDEEAAKTVALQHAGLAESEVSFLRVHRDYDDGRNVYDVEFYTADYTEYDYEIDAASGDILSFDSDAEDFTPRSENESAITEDELKDTVLAKVPGATAADIKEFHKDFDDGRKVYEGTLFYDSMEYEFELDAETGKILSWDSEPIFEGIID